MKLNNEYFIYINTNDINFKKNKNEIPKIKKLKRNSSFELLRIILMILIILFHIKFYSKSIPIMNTINYTQLINKRYIFLRIISNYGKFGDILFIMISGYFSINRKKFHYIKFILIATETYIYHYLFLYISYQLKSIYKEFIFLNQNRISQYFPLISSTGHWFSQHYLLLLIFMPFINIGLLSLNYNQYKLLVILIIVLYCIIKSLINIFNISSNLFQATQFLKLLLPYIIGGYIKVFDLKWHFFWKVGGILFFIATIILEIIFDYLSFYSGSYIWITIQNELSLQLYSLFPILSSIGIIYLFKNIEIYIKTINFISASILGIYLIHANKYIASFLYNFIIKSNYDNQTFFFLKYIRNCFLIFFVCFIIDLIRRKTIGLLVENIIQKFIK